METVYCEHIGEIKKEKAFLEKKLGVKLQINGRQVTIEATPYEEYEASLILEAISFGYPAKTAMLLKDEELVFRIIPIKNFTRRKDMEVVKGRLIGTEGKTKKTIERIADCKIIIRDNEVGIFAPADEIDYIITAVTSIIRGSKQSNIYKFLEKINADRK